MNAFLAGLVDRAQGRAPVLERRPRALFEPQRPLPARVDEIEPEAAVDWPAPAASPPRSEPQTIGQPIDRPGGPVAAARPQAPSSREPAPPPTRKEPVPTQAASIAAALRPLPRLAESAEVERPRSVHGPAAPEPTGDPGRLPSRRSEAAGAASATAAVRLKPAAAVAHEPRSPVAPRPAAAVAATVQHLHQHSTIVTTRTSRATPASARPAVLLAKAAQQGPARREPAAAVNAPPPVQITIGRVEVRALQPAAERARPGTPAAPRLSLDDYLRRRSGASR